MEFGRKGPTAQITPIAVPRSQELVLLKGSLEAIEQKLERLLKEGALPDENPPIQLDFGFFEALQTEQSKQESTKDSNDNPLIWLEVEVDGDDYLSDLQSRVETIVEGKPVELLRVRRKRKERTHSLERAEKETLNELNVDDVFARRLAEEEALPEDLLGQLTKAFNEVRNELEEARTAEEASA